ncbi:lytic transglycosylase [Streptomyces sp. UNOC14_S4]|uniref:lytic transglycosylase domain-containing protein n=1 Tax=Streptomyces sp. UNOC14_S4 TaxID=2872340 RepID=UPI001E4BAAC8|nr:lytic transglycosylase [Streptomyces sp. UNOC14_S4]MCC3769112.1 lytic murein transglycosylase [Streptomyces sp. UNOC14_S4]
MKTPPRTRATGASHQGLGAALLLASLAAAVLGASPPHTTAGGSTPSPKPENPQSRPHGTPHLALPGLAAHPGGISRPGTSTPGGSPHGVIGGPVTGIPATALAAYQHAAGLAKDRYPHCHIPWQLIAGIGKVESEHASGYGLRTDGSTQKPVIGPALTGGTFELVKDTDGGKWDGDTVYDHAVGPLQFLPSTWESYGADGRGLGIKDPHNIFDAAAGTARYLCSGDKNLNNPADLDTALLSYNNSRAYANTVKAWMRTYQNGKADPPPDTGHTTDPSSTPRPSTHPARKPRTPTARGEPNEQPSQQNTPSKPPEPPPPSNPGTVQGDSRQDDKHSRPAPSTPVADRLEPLSSNDELTATTGGTFNTLPSVKVTDAHGEPVPGAYVTFEIAGETSARFPNKARTATVPTNDDGTATAPRITAGDVPGRFTVLTVWGFRRSFTEWHQDLIDGSITSATVSIQS